MKIPQEVLAVLSTMTVDGLVARLPEGKLDRKLYERTNAVLVELGGKWKTGKGHVFATDPTERLDQAIVSGEISTAKETGFFPTPIALAKRLVELADVRPGMHVLEPSAGTGRIAAAVLRVPKVTLVCVEVDVDRAESLATLAIPDRVEIESADFLSVKPVACFDRVVANPPFARQQDIDHVRHAFSFLKPGGRLVSVMSASVSFRQDHKATEFRKFVAANCGTIEALPEDSFKESGTSVNAVVVTLVKAVTVESVIAAAGR